VAESSFVKARNCQNKAVEATHLHGFFAGLLYNPAALIFEHRLSVAARSGVTGVAFAGRQLVLWSGRGRQSNPNHF
jgi:hypothetical protein